MAFLAGNFINLTMYKSVCGDVCGMQIKNYNDIQEYDTIEAYQEVEVKKKLK